MQKPIKISRTLYVGLGGTGVKAILRAKQCFMDAYGEIPPMVAFLAIDTDKGIRDKSLKTRKGGDVKLSDNELYFCGIGGSALDIYRINRTKFTWIPERNVDYLSGLRNTGAGQIRSNGRFLVRYNAENIQRLVSQKVTEIARPLPVGSRFVYDTNKDGVEYPTKVYVVSSTAGGTGSGTVIDMLVLIAKALKDSGQDYSIIPWLVLPEVFRHIAPGPASANVYQNAYGVLKELDYLYHLSTKNQNPLDFGFDQWLCIDECIGETYLINNTNKAGISFQTVDEVTDSIGRCLFLPANEVDSVMDNTRNARSEYNIRNKKAHYMSAGSAELVYDNQAVGNVVAKGIIINLCQELLKEPKFDMNKEVRAWTTSDAVGIEEHGVNMLTDNILSLYPPYPIPVGKDTDKSWVENCISNADAYSVRDKADENFKRIKERVWNALDEKINQLLNSKDGVGHAISFLKSLLIDVDLCKQEMEDEKIGLDENLKSRDDWDSKLKDLHKGLIIKRFDEGAAESLAEEIKDCIADKRDSLRHKLAIQFYTDFEQLVKERLNKLYVFKTNIEEVKSKQECDIQTIQHYSRTNSKFQIYLHSEDVEHCAIPNVEELLAKFMDKTPIADLVGMDSDRLYKTFFAFAKNLQPVVDAVNVTIEDKMRDMPEDKLKEIWAKIKEMSMPLWVTDTQGYMKGAQELTTVFTIGVCDQEKSILKEKYADEFKQGVTKPTFASTHETDRITFFQTQCYSPVYAVNNMRGYKREADDNLKKGKAYPVYYLDEKWHQRMLDEGFDMWPETQKDTVLPNWVMAIVYGFVKNDGETYSIQSKKGNVIKGGFFELGDRRDRAFDKFQASELDKEVEERIKKMIQEQGCPAVVKTIKDVKDDWGNYVDKYAKLLPIELDRVNAEDSAYDMVSEQLEREIKCLMEYDI